MKIVGADSIFALRLLKKYIAFMYIDEKEFYDLMLKEKPPFISRRC